MFDWLCRGTGIMTCPYCHGTKALRKRPAVFMMRSLRGHDPVNSQWVLGWLLRPC